MNLFSAKTKLNIQNKNLLLIKINVVRINIKYCSIGFLLVLMSFISVIGFGQAQKNEIHEWLKTVSPGLANNLDTTILRFYNKQLVALPKEIGQLQNLILIDLRDNKLTKLPKEIGRLKNLTNLKVESNRLSELPKEIGKLKKLTELYVSSSKKHSFFVITHTNLTNNNFKLFNFSNWCFTYFEILNNKLPHSSSVLT